MIESTKTLNIGIDLSTRTTGIAFLIDGFKCKSFLIKNQKFNPNIFKDTLINFSIINKTIEKIIKDNVVERINIGIEVSNFAHSNNEENHFNGFQNKFNPMISNWFHFYAGLIYGLVQWNFKDSNIVFKWKFFNANEWFPKFLEEYNKKNLTNYSVNFLDSFSRKKLIVDFYLETFSFEKKEYLNDFGKPIIYKSKEWYLEIANELEALSIARYFEHCESTIQRGQINSFKRNFAKKKKITMQQQIIKLDSKINKTIFEINKYVSISHDKKLTKPQENKKIKLEQILENLKNDRFKISKKEV